MACAVMAMIGTSCRLTADFRVADVAGSLEAVHLGHLDVHEHQVVGHRLERPDGLGAVGHRLRAQAQSAQDAERHLLVGDIVLGQQDAQSSTTHLTDDVARDDRRRRARHSRVGEH